MSRQNESDVWGDNLKEYLEEMTDLAIKYRIGITHECYLYQMEDGSDGDFDRTFRVEEDGKLEFI